jgi:transposase
MHPNTDHLTPKPAATLADNATIYVSLELSRSKWLATSLSPASDKMSKYFLAGGDGAALLQLFSRLKTRAERTVKAALKLIVIQEAGLDGFWLHRLLEANNIESHVVDPASIAIPRRYRRSKTDRIDGETLLRTLAAFKRGEPRVCSMVVPPTTAEEDRRRISRERQTLLRERIQHTNRIRGVLLTQGISSYHPLHPERRKNLEKLRTGIGQALPPHLKAQIIREIDRLELVITQIEKLEAERDANAKAPGSPVAMLMRLKSVGPELATGLYHEALFRTFSTRRQLAAFAGLTPTPWQSGTIAREQGISKAGNPRLRTQMVELAWLWVRYQPDSPLSLWFCERVGSQRGRVRRIAIVAVARKLLIALWRYLTDGLIPEGAVLKQKA